jgi:hypothetical protein
MLSKPTKAVLTVGLIALLLGSASLLLAAADGYGAGDMTKLEPGAQHWYTLAYPGSGTVEVRLDVDPDVGATFMIVTPDAVRAWEAGAELVATGRGTHNPHEEADLFWTGGFDLAGDFALIVEYSGDGVTPSLYSLDVSGAEVSSDAAAGDGLPANADGIWCYRPLGPPVLVDVGFEPAGKQLWAGHYLGEWTGTFQGVSEDTGLMVAHEIDPGPPPIAAPMLYIGTVTFAEVEVAGVSGGLEMDLNMEILGESPGTASQGKGRWIITSGTGDLQGFRAEGAWWGPGWNPEKPEECGVIYYSVDD